MTHTQILAPDHCQCCAAPIEQPPASGRRRQFCSAACRQRAVRAARARVRAVVKSVAGGAQLEAQMRAALAQLPDDLFELATNPDEAAVLALAEAWVLVDRLERVAAVTRPELAARCSGVAAALAAALV